MAYGQIDPARLDGDALTRWYLRSAADIEQERDAAAAQKYADFFGDQPGSFAQPNDTTLGQLGSGLAEVQFGQDGPTRLAPAPYGDFDLTPGDNGVSGGGKRAPDSNDPTTVASVSFETSHSNGNMPVASGRTKDQCIQQCSPPLERYQPPGSDRNRWDFHKCVNACMDPNHRSGPNSSPYVPVRPGPTPSPLPWWMWIPRLIPEAAAVLA